MSETPFEVIELSLERLALFVRQVEGIETGEAFTAQYGLFERQRPAVRSMLSALKWIKCIEPKVGDAEWVSTRSASNPNVLSTPLTSDEPLALSLAKMACVVSETARTIKHGLENMATMELTAETTKRVLAPPGGLAEAGQGVIAGVAVLKDVVQSIARQLEPSLGPVAETFLYSTAIETIATQERAIPRLLREVQQAQKALDSAVFDAQEKAQKLEQWSTELAVARATLSQKTAFKNAYEGLDTKSSEVIVSLMNIHSMLVDIAEVFSRFRSTCTSMTTLASEAQLSDPEWVAKSLETSRAISIFQRISKQAAKYVQRNAVAREQRRMPHMSSPRARSDALHTSTARVEDISRAP